MPPLRERMVQDLRLRGLSPRTQEAYVGAVRQLAAHDHKSPAPLGEDDLRQYFLYLQDVNRVAPSTLSIARSGIKCLYQRTLGRDWPTLALIRAPHVKTLPVVLSSAEGQRVLGGVPTRRYRLCRSTIDACGRRVQAGVPLPVGDIDGARWLVHVRHGTGHQDRYVPLPPRSLELLRWFWRSPRLEQVKVNHERTIQVPHAHQGAFQRDRFAGSCQLRSGGRGRSAKSRMVSGRPSQHMRAESGAQPGADLSRMTRICEWHEC